MLRNFKLARKSPDSQGHTAPCPYRLVIVGESLLSFLVSLGIPFPFTTDSFILTSLIVIVHHKDAEE